MSGPMEPPFGFALLRRAMEAADVATILTCYADNVLLTVISANPSIPPFRLAGIAELAKHFRTRLLPASDPHSGSPDNSGQRSAICRRLPVRRWRVGASRHHPAASQRADHQADRPRRHLLLGQRLGPYRLIGFFPRGLGHRPSGQFIASVIVAFCGPPEPQGAICARVDLVCRGETMDQLRTNTAELTARQRSAMDTSERWFTLGQP